MVDLRTTIFDLFGASEAHELPAAIFEVVLNPELMNKVGERYRNMFPDLSIDVLRQYFQDNQSDRSVLKQDYTPGSICRIVAEVAGNGGRIGDLCAGTGSLTLAAWNINPAAHFVCYEVSSASIPFLLFNLAVRSIEADVVQGDLLANEVKTVYQIRKGRVSATKEVPESNFDGVVLNPPYSLKWSGKSDSRTSAYPAAPKSKADFMFVLIGLSMLNDNGKLCAILPHGVLFRGATEGKIRQQLVEEGRLDSVIGLAPNLFSHTTIPTVLFVLNKGFNRLDPVMVIDASDIMVKKPKQNELTSENIDEIIKLFCDRKEVAKKARLVSIEEIAENGFNLNIPRYVDNYEPPAIPDPAQTLKEIIRTERSIRQTKLDLLHKLQEFRGTDPEAQKELDETRELFKLWLTT